MNNTTLEKPKVTYLVDVEFGAQLPDGQFSIMKIGGTEKVVTRSVAPSGIKCYRCEGEIMEPYFGPWDAIVKRE